MKKPNNRLLRRDVAVKHWEAMLASGKTLQTYAFHAGLYRSLLILSFIRHLPQQWKEHEGKLGPIPVGICENCGREFYKNSGGQKCCTYSCSTQRWLAGQPDQHERHRIKAAKWRARKKAEKQALESGDGKKDPPG